MSLDRVSIAPYQPFAANAGAQVELAEQARALQVLEVQVVGQIAGIDQRIDELANRVEARIRNHRIIARVSAVITGALGLGAIGLGLRNAVTADDMTTLIGSSVCPLIAGVMGIAAAIRYIRYGLPR